jgi:hypothetical protein
MSEQGINNMSDFENILLSSDRIAATEFIASIRATHSIESISENYVVPALTSIGKAWGEWRCITLTGVYEWTYL